MAECAIALPETVNLDVPYLSQQDNQENPSGSCNVTSCAMVLRYFQKVGNGDGQLEDQLYRECLDRGLSRHDPYDLQTLLRSHGIQDTFRPDAKWEDAKAHLAAGNPLICHGYFTRSGHIIVIRGYCPGGWHVNDP
ncbi:MAG TPA: C39 family peptidase, partial [Coleofasciculaceae cyanobacterium]